MGWLMSGLIIVLAVCSGCAATAAPLAPGKTVPTTNHEVSPRLISVTTPLFPQKIIGWQFVTTGIDHSLGKTLSVGSDSLDFSIAGKVTVEAVGSYGNGHLFRMTAESPAARTALDRYCGGNSATYLALSPGEITIIHDPIVKISVFTGKAKPIAGHELIKNYDSTPCTQFSYGAPSKS